MLLTANATDAPVVEATVRQFVDGFISTLPRVVAGVLFLLIAYLAIRIIRSVARSALSRIYPLEEALVVDLTVAILGVFLWFGALLTLLDIVGMGDIAASLGTATGFVGLGVAFALKEMIADTVAGVYLLQDPDFEVGDRVTTASVTGAVEGIDLRKTRIRLDDGDLVVLANREVEKKWTNEAEESPAGPETDSATE
jgi:small-conductance mechanosensitive channel